MVKVEKATSDGREYFVIFIDNECYMQRTETVTAFEDPLKPHEKMLVRICEHMCQK